MSKLTKKQQQDTKYIMDMVHMGFFDYIEAVNKLSKIAGV